MALRKAGGNWVVGDRFFDREVEIEGLVERVEGGVHTLVTAQRRMGKTSLVRELLRRLKERGDHETAFADLQDCSTAADAVVEIATAVRHTRSAWGRIGEWIDKSIAGRVDQLQVGDLRVQLRARINAGQWRPRGDALFQSLAKGDAPLVIAVDELPILVNRLLKGQDYRITPERRRDTDSFLSWLRKNVLAHRDGLVLVVSGSVGLEPILEQAGPSAHANMLDPFELRPWDEDTAVECLRALAKQYRLRVSEHGRTRTGGSATTPVRGILHVLEHDGYLAREDGGYRFVSGLVEDWWRQRFGMSFVPFGERHR